jgi:hypothetical protein
MARKAEGQEKQWRRSKMATEKKDKQSFVLYRSAFTSAIARMSDKRKADILTAIFAYAGCEHAVMPEIDELLEAVLAPIFDAMTANAKKYEAKCEANRAIGASGGRKKAENAAKRKAPNPTESYRTVENLPKATDRYRKLAILPEATDSTETYHEYDNEYELTTTAKSNNILLTTNVGSKYREATESYRTVENLPKATERYDSVDDDDWPPDYDPAEAFGGDLQDDFTEPDDSEEDRPF